MKDSYKERKHENIVINNGNITRSSGIMAASKKHQQQWWN
jgi:hypothetical protein